jgi:hypothetical protein
VGNAEVEERVEGRGQAEEGAATAPAEVGVQQGRVVALELQVSRPELLQAGCRLLLRFHRKDGENSTF